MMLTVDTLAQRYHLLPTEVMDRATTFDLRVASLANSHQRYLQQQAEHDSQNPGQRRARLSPNLSVEQMQAMIDRVKGQNDQG